MNIRQRIAVRRLARQIVAEHVQLYGTEPSEDLVASEIQAIVGEIDINELMEIIRAIIEAVMRLISLFGGPN